MPDPARGKTLSFTDAAEKILDALGGKPLHYLNITSHALEHRMLDTSGKTPEATMYAQILTEVKRRQRRGEPQRFMVLGKGMISSAKWQAKGLAFQVEEANKKARKDLLKLVKAMNPGEFEDLIGRLLAAIGFEEVEVTSRTNDGGIDVRGTLVVGDVIRTRLAVQVKRWKHNIQSPVIQQVRGSLGSHEQGLVITTSDFSKGARDEAERANTTPVGLLNGEQLVALLVENEIGVSKTPLQLIQLGETNGNRNAGE
jgi:restriction system protein